LLKQLLVFFTEQRIYPGHGINFIRRDGKKLEFVNRKAKNLYLGDRKPLNLRWTKQWRRAHKKESILRQVKKEKRKALKADRGIEGLSIQDLLRKKKMKVKMLEKQFVKKNQKFKLMIQMVKNYY